MSNTRITPFIRRMRTKGGTIYTFSSSTEDIGINISEKNNVVKISNFALLNIPKINWSSNLSENYFNVLGIDGAWNYEQNLSSVKDGRILIAESFQNYALNLESLLLSDASYNATLSTTVSERVFWKWLKETGAIRYNYDSSTSSWIEELDTDGSAGYNNVVKCIGQISAGNVRSDTFGTYNETYVLIPTSYGQVQAHFEQREDENYYHGKTVVGGTVNIAGRSTYTLPHPDALSFNAYYDYVTDASAVGTSSMSYDNSTGTWTYGWWYNAEGITPSNNYSYIIDNSSYIDSKIYHTDLRYTGGSNNFSFRRSKVDCLSLIFDLNKLKTIYGDPNLTFDTLATTYSINDNFDFNTVLIYYSVYNNTMDTILATNLLGVLFLDTPSGNTTTLGNVGIEIPSLTKLQSGPTGFGTSYSLRLNIKTDTLLDNTQAIINDESTSAQTAIEDLSDIFYELEKSVNILGQQSANIKYISDQYNTISNQQQSLIDNISDLTYQVNDITRDITGTAGTLAMFSDGDDPLVETSIYMKLGKIGIFTNNPVYKLDIDTSIKTKDIYLESYIKDVSYYNIIGQVATSGSSANIIQLGDVNKKIFVYSNTTSSLNPILRIDSSIRIKTNLNLDQSLNITGNLNVGGTTGTGINNTILGNVYMCNNGTSLDTGRLVLRQGTNRTSPGIIFRNQSTTGIYNTGVNDFNIACSATDVFKANNTGAKLYLANGTLAAPSLTFTADNSLGMYYGGTGYRISFCAKGVENFRMDVSSFLVRGAITANSVTLSDKRLKNNISYLENSLETISLFNGIKYNYLDSSENHFGLIAQDVEKILPDLIYETNVLDKPDTKYYKAIKYTEIIPFLIESIKELKTQIDELKNKLNS